MKSINTFLLHLSITLFANTLPGYTSLPPDRQKLKGIFEDESSHNLNNIIHVPTSHGEPPKFHSEEAKQIYLENMQKLSRNTLARPQNDYYMHQQYAMTQRYPSYYLSQDLSRSRILPGSTAELNRNNMQLSRTQSNLQFQHSGNRGLKERMAKAVLPSANSSKSKSRAGKEKSNETEGSKREKKKKLMQTEIDQVEEENSGTSAAKKTSNPKLKLFGVTVVP